MNTATKEEIVVIDEAEIELNKETTAVEAMANSLVITDNETLVIAKEEASKVKDMQNKVKEYWEPMRVSAKAAYDNVLAKKKEMLDPLEAAEKTIKGKMGDYVMEQERARKAKEAEMQRLAQLEAEKKMQEAIEAQKAGDALAAEMALAEAEAYDDASATAVIPKQEEVKGMSKTKTWKITGIDSSKVPDSINGIEIRPVDEKAVIRLIKMSKGQIKIPGVEYVEDVIISVRS